MFEITYFDGWNLVIKTVVAGDVMVAINNSGCVWNQILKVERVPERQG